MRAKYYIAVTGALGSVGSFRQSLVVKVISFHNHPYRHRREAKWSELPNRFIS